MWSTELLRLFVIVALQIHRTVSQLGNSTFSVEDILDEYKPLPLRGNITRIVGGQPINIIQVPWQIALYKDGTFICGGSIISKDWILTAAHCIESGGRYVIRAGSPNKKKGGQIRDADIIVINGGFSTMTMNHDIALIRVGSPLSFTSHVRSVNIARANNVFPLRYFVSGWGLISENGSRPARLRGVSVGAVSRTVCRRKYSTVNVRITKYMICAASPGKDACAGDSGGPLVNGNVQFGIVSFGDGCARPNYPGVYTNLRRQYGWIRKVIRRYGGEMPTFV